MANGGIAPFSVLTNGKDSKIFDSITGEEITDEAIPSSHHYVRNGFRVSADSIKARAEALEYLISLSSENLLLFCKGQVEFRMELLKSNDLHSGKKYIPQLYVERSESTKELEDKLLNKTAYQVLLVIGPPQQGKTCFVCHTVEQFLDQGIPCLFYPAIALKKGLFNEMQDDFQWAFGENISSTNLALRLNRIVEKTGQKFLIFVDGWNEMIDHALILNDECQRLKNTGIQLVLSTTSPSLNRLLRDEADNLSYTAKATNLTYSFIQKLTNEPLRNTDTLGIVQVGKFNGSELEIGKKIYGEAFKVEFANDSNLPEDPFYLRLASEQYSNGIVPVFATRSNLISQSLIKKGSRRNIGKVTLFNGLNHIAQIIVKKDTPFASTELPQEMASDITLAQWIESGILICLNEKVVPVIDFYYTHEKDYCLAIINKKWNEVFAGINEDIILQEFQDVIKNEATKSALRWFLSCPEYVDILKLAYAKVKDKIAHNTELFEIIINAIIFQDLSDLNWLRQMLDNTSVNSVYAYAAAVVKHTNVNFSDFSLLLKLIIGVDQKLDLDLSSLEDSIEVTRAENLIELYLRKKTNKTAVQQKREHFDLSLKSKSDVNPIFNQIYTYLAYLIANCDKVVARRSAKLFSWISPRVFFIHIANSRSKGQIQERHIPILHEAMHHCLEYFYEDYHGKCMTPGLLYDPFKYSSQDEEDEENEDEDEEDESMYNCKDEPDVIDEYNNMKDAYIALLQLFSTTKCIYSPLSSLWDDLTDNVSISEKFISNENNSPSQLELDL